MKYRKLGHTGYDTSEIGFGTWQIGGMRWKKLSDKDSIDLLMQSNDLGVNLFDVAIVYGQYQSENNMICSRSQELLGKAFSNRRENVIYTVKLGQFDEYTHKHDFHPRRLIKQFQESLTNLKTGYIDICLIHAPSIFDVKNEKAITVLKTLQSLGYVKSIGYSFEAEPLHVKEAVKQDIDVLMLQYNLIDQSCKKAIDLANQHGIGILAGGPYKRGYLTGNYKTTDALPKEDDYWRWNLSLCKDKVSSILEEVNGLLNVYKTPAELKKQALKFILNKENIASCVIGHRSLSEVIENIKFISE